MSLLLGVVFVRLTHMYVCVYMHMCMYIYVCVKAMFVSMCVYAYIYLSLFSMNKNSLSNRVP